MNIFYKVVFTTICLIGILTTTASAHRPAVAEVGSITTISDPETSFAYYQELGAPGQVDIYQFEAPANQFFHAGVNIPQIADLKRFGVNMALIGPGLPLLNQNELSFSKNNTNINNQTLNQYLGISELTGVIVPSEMGKDFYEPFTQTNYWGRQVLELDLPETGTYYLIVWQPHGEVGKYVLDTGREEVFGFADIFRFPVWWVNVRLYFEQTGYLIGLGVLIITLIMAPISYWRYKRQEKQATVSSSVTV